MQAKLENEQLQALINEVPTGIGVYEVLDGVITQSYLNHAFYEMLGADREDRVQFLGENSLNAAHPDDIMNIQEAIARLLAGEDKVIVTYRLQSGSGDWIWIQLTGAVVKRTENYIKIYASFVNYDNIMKAQMEADRRKNTLEIALQSAKVLAWRYNYLTKQITDPHTLGKAYHLPKVIENVPEAIVNMGFIHKDSVEDFLQMFDNMKSGNVVTSEIRANSVDGKEYLWYQMVYTPVYDQAGNYVDSIGVAIDITEQKKRVEKYKEKIRLNQMASRDALSKVNVNLSQNVITSYEFSSPEFRRHQKLKTADELLESINDDLNDEAEIRKFNAVKNRKILLEAYANGETHFEVTYHIQNNARWANVVYDLLENPYTGDIELISSIHDVTDRVRSQLVVDKLLEVEYQSILVIDNETGIAYPFNNNAQDQNLQEITAAQEETGDKDLGLEHFLEHTHFQTRWKRLFRKISWKQSRKNYLKIHIMSVCTP